MSWFCEEWFFPSKRILVPVAVIVLGLTPALTLAQRLDLDPAKCSVSIHVFKSGLFSSFAHDHTIQAPVATGNLDMREKSVTLTFNVADMKVLDPGISDSERKDIDTTMKGPKVLDGAQFPSISFTSSSVKSSEDNNEVTGTLKLHGVSRTLTAPVTLSNGKYTGSLSLKQTDFGITPVKIAGGAVRVKDEITIEFSIVSASLSAAGGASQ
jgi:polyisoprenoid-binding protein YceI